MPQAALIALVLLSLPGTPSTHDRAFWVSIPQNKYEVPAGDAPFPLLVEMNDLLGSTDPVLRDDVAYGAAARWMYTKRLLTTEQQRELLRIWLDNLSHGLGETGTDSVFRRSFSALNLSLIAALDNQASFLTQAEFDDLLKRALDYLRREQDTRGYDPVKGWMHTPAHTADLLKFLARNQKLSRPMQIRVLDAAADKCRAVGHTFAWGEDERLAEVVRSVVRRADFDAAAFDGWLTRFSSESQTLWAHAPAIDANAFPGVQNQKLLLRALYVALSQDTELSAPATGVRERILRALK